MSSTTPVALVLAAGTGVRFGGDVPKQLLPLGGRPLMVHAIDQHGRLGHHVIAVVSATIRSDIEAVLADHLSDRAVTLVDGGDTRRESVLAGIAAIPVETGAETAVILRNAASPNTADEVVDACVVGLRDRDGMQAYRPSDTTTFRHDGERLLEMIPRPATGFTCDPTVYRRSVLDKIGALMVDDDSGETTLDIALRLGISIGLTLSPASNIKVTTSSDLSRVAREMGLRPEL